VGLGEELERIAALAAPYAADGESLAGILAAEPARGRRVYVCAFADGEGARTWLALDAEGAPVSSPATVREAVSIAALCELAEETAAGGELEELRSQLVRLRVTESPPGIEEAEEAALELERTLLTPPRVASPEYLDAIGAATRRLEQALGDGGPSPFAEAMRQGVAAVEELAADVERHYKVALGS
jgi:hypothetical protein